ncbi:SCO3242 family prenyltransferase [Streptomyces sp. NPDC005355]|uniref:SCO3242 family prenyltransferase n=1 Tax=Streptomyces sp. NPDC005355 TaxID=3157038 RepID=UPI0033BBAF32
MTAGRGRDGAPGRTAGPRPGTNAGFGAGHGFAPGSGPDGGARLHSGTGTHRSAGTDPHPRPGAVGVGRRAAAWAELLRVSALFTVPGDAFAGAAAARCGPNRGTALAACASLCLYEAGMALNDWADRDIDAVERPGRPLPSGRIAPAAALAAATGLTAAGLLCAAAAGRPALTTATVLAGTVWAYDLALKNTPAGPPAMAAARALDLLLGATASAVASGGSVRCALPSAALLGAHTLAVTTVSRREAVGGSSAAPLAALATGAAIAWSLARRPTSPPSPQNPPGGRGAARRPAPWPVAGGARAGAAATAVAAAAPPARGFGITRRPTTGHGPMALPTAVGGDRRQAAPARTPSARGLRVGRGAVIAAAVAAVRPAAGDRAAPTRTPPARHLAVVRRTAAAATGALAAAYMATAARPLAHAALNPSPYLLQRAVGGGIRAMIPLQAALASRAGAQRTALSLLALVPVARRLSRKVSPT